MNDAGRAVADHVRRNIHRLDLGIDDDRADARADLAKLRRGLGKTPVDAPEIWAITMIAEGGADRSPYALGKAAGDEPPTPEEWAIHIALTFYALHRQGHSQSMSEEGARNQGKSRDGPSFGAAMGALRRQDANKELGVIRRFKAAITASDLKEFSRHALGAVQLLRAAATPVKLDYPAFAADLYRYQFPDSRERVVLKWGRHFWRDGGENSDGGTKAEDKLKK